MRTADTYVYRKGTTPNTRVAISQKNRVYSIPYGKDKVEKQIGVLATFDYSESRSIDPVRGVGFGDKIQELVPGVTEPMSLTLNRTLLYTAGIAQEVGYRGGIDGLVRSLRHHKWPFDISSELVFSELVSKIDYEKMVGAGATYSSRDTLEGAAGYYALLTYFEACWLNSISVSFPSDSAIVMEDAQATCTDVTDGASIYTSYGELMDSGNSPFLENGSSKIFGAR